MLTPKYPLTQLNLRIASHIDVFICCSSFEGRCKAIAESLEAERVAHCLVAQNENNAFYVGANGKHLLGLFPGKVEKVEINTNDPIVSTDSFIYALKRTQREDKQNFLVDITTFTRESLLILVRLLKYHLKQSDRLQFVYVGAQKYSLNTDELWLSRGIREVRSVLGYPGESLPTRDLHLVLLMGFEYERASQLIESCEPSILSLGYSEDATEPSHAKKNKQFHGEVASLYTNVNQFIFSATDPVATKEAIVAQQRQYPGHNTVVAPMNTKLSTLGAALAVFDDVSIQLCYAQAETYNVDKYSEAQKDFYLFEPEMSKFVGG